MLIITSALQAALFPAKSITVKIRFLVEPTSLQAKLLGETSKDAIVQLSELPLFISAGLTLITEPAAVGRIAIIAFLHFAIGSVLSSTTTL